MVEKRTAASIVSAACLLAVLASSAQQSFAQLGYYSGSDQTVGGVSNSTLQKCTTLGIDRNQCSDATILLKERIVEANANAVNGGSGTPMLATQLGQLAMFIGILGAVFGGVAAAFFISGRNSKDRITV